MSPTRDDVGAILGSILAAEKDGLSLKHLNVEYKSIVGEWIPFKDCEHSSLAAFLEGMPDVVALRRAPNGDVTAHAARNAATAHITKMVAQQKPGKSRGPGPIRLRSQHTQRPCHWKVHPYHKNPQLQTSENWSTRKFNNSGFTSGSIKIKTEPKDDVSPPEPKRAPLVPVPAPQKKKTTRTTTTTIGKLVPAASRRPLVSLDNPIAPAKGTNGTGVRIKSEPEEDVSPPERPMEPILPTPAPRTEAAVKPKPAPVSRPVKQRAKSPVRSPAPVKKVATSRPVPAAPQAPKPARRPKSPIASPAQATGAVIKPRPAARKGPVKRPEGLTRSSEPAKKKVASGQDSLATPRQPLRARRPKSPILSPAPEKVATGKMTRPVGPPARLHPRRPPLSPPTARGRRPLKLHPDYNRSSSWHTDLSPAMPHSGPAGLDRPTLHWWLGFVERAGVNPRRIFAYARVLLRQGVDPSSLWLFTSKDIFQMGIRNYYDINLIQEQACLWRQCALGCSPPPGDEDWDEQWQPSPAFDRGPRRRINFQGPVQERRPYYSKSSANYDLRVTINRKRSLDCPDWDRTVHSVHSTRAARPKRPYSAMKDDWEWERPPRQHFGYQRFEGPRDPWAARRPVRGRKPVY